MRTFFVLLLLCPLVASTSAQAAGRESVHASPNDVQPLLPGMSAPAFTVTGKGGQVLNFDPASMSKPVVLTFYRGGWCPYCNLHLSELRLAEAQLLKMGFEVWFVSMDSPEMLTEGMEGGDFNYRLFSDAGGNATRAFGIAFRLDDKTYRRYISYGVDLEQRSGRNHHILPVPSTFIIGRNGLIRFAYSNPDYKVRLHPDVLLAAARVYLQDADARFIKERQERGKE